MRDSTNRQVLKMAEYYHQDAKSEYSDDIHPRLSEAVRFFEMIPDEVHDEFYAQVISYCPVSMFQPSFPSRILLSDCYNAFIAKNDARINKKESYTLEDVAEKFGKMEGVEYDKLESRNIPIEQVIEDSKRMTADALIRKYGVKKCGEAWWKMGEDMTEAEHEEWQRNRRREVVRRDLQNERDRYGYTSVERAIENDEYRIR